MSEPARLAAVAEDDKDVLVVDLNSLTVGEIELAEELSGQPITYSLDPDKPKGRIMRAIGCAVRRRSDPEFTWEQAAGLKVFFGSESAVPPTSGRGSSTRSRSRNTSRS